MSKTFSAYHHASHCAQNLLTADTLERHAKGKLHHSYIDLAERSFRSLADYLGYDVRKRIAVPWDSRDNSSLATEPNGDIAGRG